jgi:hypothetical protein
MSKTTKVTTFAGRTFMVRLVEEGDAYGREDCLTHRDRTPLVEFYDATYAGRGFGPRGQFVSRYYLDTLTGEGSFSQGDLRVGMNGLNLHFGEPAWKLDAQGGDA